jgi:hypothetical protein
VFWQCDSLLNVDLSRRTLKNALSACSFAVGRIAATLPGVVWVPGAIRLKKTKAVSDGCPFAYFSE